MILREEYQEIGLRCIKKYPELELLKEHPCSIAFLGSQKEKKSRGSRTYAECHKIPDKYKWMSENAYDFMITVYEKNCADLSDAQMEILIWHELMHIGVEAKDDGTASYYIKDHDVQDFRAILKAHGVDWALPEWSKKPDDQIPGQMSLVEDEE